uniref:Putative secreted protein n=1 Tax=Rhipicephalus microplus TaxID=6941 RepID=A0A6G5A368_RHIMP
MYATVSSCLAAAVAAATFLSSNTHVPNVQKCLRGLEQGKAPAATGVNSANAPCLVLCMPTTCVLTNLHFLDSRFSGNECATCMSETCIENTMQF